jgi:hypothetical protein|tara:strand:- start:285 stop:479 length:195 start_codon:yes stop_codon:yes gene_type:complete
MSILLLIIPFFMSENSEFINTMNKEMKDGYTWNYVGPTPLSKGSKSISIIPKVGDPYIIYKLKK